MGSVPFTITQRTVQFSLAWTPYGGLDEPWVRGRKWRALERTEESKVVYGYWVTEALAWYSVVPKTLFWAGLPLQPPASSSCLGEAPLLARLG